MIAEMISIKNLVILCSVIQLLTCALVEACEGQHKVDFLMLSMTWLPGACKLGKVNCKPGVQSNVFSIHGLWPQKYNGKVENCCTTEVYQDQKIAPLKRSLRANWRSITPGPEDGSWRYQFNKHGSCAIGKVAGIKDVKDFFTLGIDEFTRLDLQRTLQDGGYKIKTNNPYNGSDILRYLQSTYGFKFQMVCHPLGHSRLVFEIRACYDTNMNQIDCKYTAKPCLGPISFQ